MPILGFNPVGEHAPTLPRHDAPLPGHVPGAPPVNTASGTHDASSANVAYGASNLPPWFGVWFGRVVVLVVMFITLPVQVALYPVAGICGVALGLPFYLVGAENPAYYACFIGLLAAMRVETGVFEKRFPGYRAMRHWLRLGLIFAFMTYFVVHDKGDTLAKAVLMSAIVTGFAHFFLRWGMTRGLWDGLQTWAWLRKE